MEPIKLTRNLTFCDIAFIRATCRSVATCLAPEESLSVGIQERKLGIAIPITTEAMDIATISSSKVNPEAARLHPNFFMITSF